MSTRWCWYIYRRSGDRVRAPYTQLHFTPRKSAYIYINTFQQNFIKLNTFINDKFVDNGVNWWWNAPQKR